MSLRVAMEEQQPRPLSAYFCEYLHAIIGSVDHLFEPLKRCHTVLSRLNKVTDGWAKLY